MPDGCHVVPVYPGPLYCVRSRVRRTAYSTRRFAGAMSLLRNVMYPDAHLDWVPIALWYARKVAQRVKPDVVITSGNPVSTHMVGVVIKAVTGTRWVMDVGDPFSIVPESLHSNRSWRWRLDRVFEGWLLGYADQVVVTAERTKQAYLDAFPGRKGNWISVVRNGAEIPEARNGPTSPGEHCTFAYTGTFYKGLREPWALLDALSTINHVPLRLVLAGQWPLSVEAAVSERGLEHMVQLPGHLSSRQVYDLLHRADVLLYYGNKGGLQLPSKLFEYLAACRPILGIVADPEDEGADLIRTYRRGVTTCDEPGAIAEAITKLVGLWAENRLSTTFNLEPIAEISWSSRARLWWRLLDELQ